MSETTPTDDAVRYGEDEWHDFYESTWGARKDFFENDIRKGIRKTTTSVYRSLQKLARFESRWALGVDQKQKSTHWVRRNIDPQGFPTGQPIFIKNAFGETFADLPFYHHPVDFLLDFLDDHSFDAIVELGAGYGWNLVRLFMQGGPDNIPYYCGEYTKTGYEFSKMIKEAAPEFPLVPFRFDHTKADLSIVKDHKNILVFTCHSIEQVQDLPLSFFEILSNAAPNVTGLHFEPFGYQFELPECPFGPVSETQAQYFSEMKWNRNFAEKLQEAHLAGHIQALQVKKNVFLNSYDNPTSFAYWVSNKKNA